MSNLYSARAEEKRRQFNKLIDKIDMVLMNNIPEVDESVWENWEGKDPMGNDECEFEHEEGTEEWNCTVHDSKMIGYKDEPYECEEREYDAEVYQWFAIGQWDAEFLKDHNQYITYSDKLDTYFLAITHFGTSWDYTQMVDDFDDMYRDLDKFDDEKEVV